jgi:serine/threonine protein kinase
MDIEPGSSIAHYQIISRIGAGGMGEVYKAHDAVLGRTVALKILPADLVRNEEPSGVSFRKRAPPRLSTIPTSSRFTRSGRTTPSTTLRWSWSRE